jgi:3-deoxy-D-manno-octulosonic-acid transferase
LREQQQRLAQWQQEARPLVWAHAVSVGETLTLLPALQAWLQQEETHPAAALWFTTTTQTGQQVALQQWQGSPVLQAQAMLGFLPHESWWAMHRLQRHLKPRLLLLMETELWPGLLLWQALLHRVPVVLVNGRLSQRSFGGYWWLSRLLGLGWVLRHTLAAAWMQSPEDAARLQALGFPAARCEVMGNLKWATPSVAHRLVGPAEEAKPLCPPWLRVPSVKEAPVLVLASTHAGEEALLIEGLTAFITQHPEATVVLAPRHPERAAAVATLLKEAGLLFERRSCWKTETPSPQYLLLDTVGELKVVLPWATLAVVCGSFLPSLGGHNILEPLQAGVPVLFGPHMRHFEAVTQQVLAAKAGVQAANPAALWRSMDVLLADPQACHALVQAAQAMLSQQQEPLQYFIRRLQQQVR